MTNRFSRRLLSAALLSALFVVTSDAASACSRGIESRHYRFLDTTARAKLFVHGRITGKTTDGDAGSTTTRIDLEVIEVMRGTVTRKGVSVWSGGRGRIPCQIPDRLAALEVGTEGVFAFNEWPAPAWYRDDGYPGPFYIMENWGEMTPGRRQVRLRALRYGPDCYDGCPIREFMSFGKLRAAIKRQTAK